MSYLIRTIIKRIKTNVNHIDSTYFSDFTIKGSEGVYKVCASPNMRHLENYLQHIIQLAPGRKYFGTIT